MNENKELIKKQLVYAVQDHQIMGNNLPPSQLRFVFDGIIKELLSDFTIIYSAIIENPDEMQELYAAYIKVKDNNGVTYKAGLSHNEYYGVYVTVDEVSN